MAQTPTTEAEQWYAEHRYLFKYDHRWNATRIPMGLYTYIINGRILLRPSKREKKQPWYAKQHIRGYQK